MFDPSALLLLAALATTPDTAASTPTANDSVLASVVGPLVKPGAHARVHTEFGVVEGETQAVDPLGLHLRQEAVDLWSRPSVKPIAWAQIARLEVHRPATGAKIGAVFGALLGIATVASAAAYASGYGDVGLGGATILVGGAAGGIVGALAGALVDAAVPAWKLVYERR